MRCAGRLVAGPGEARPAVPTPTTEPISGVARSGGSGVDIPHDSGPGTAWLKLDARVGARVLSARAKLAEAPADRASRAERLISDLTHVCDALSALHRD